MLIPGPEPSEKHGNTWQLAFGEGMGLACPGTGGRVLMSENEAGRGDALLLWKIMLEGKHALKVGSAAVFGAVRAERNIPVVPCFYFFVGVHE